MIYKIEQFLDRISLHDSHIEGIEKTKEDLILTFDWAKIERFTEIDLADEGIIVGQSKLILRHIMDDKLKLSSNKEDFFFFSSSDLILTDSSIVIENEFQTLERCNQVYLGFLYNDLQTGEHFWAEWVIRYNSGYFEWNNHVAFNDWHNKGLIPE